MDQRLAEAAAQVADECLRDSSLGLADVDVIVAAPARRGYRAALASRLGVPVERITVASDEKMHTASLAAALDRWRRPIWREEAASCSSLPAQESPPAPPFTASRPREPGPADRTVAGSERRYRPVGYVSGVSPWIHTLVGSRGSRAPVRSMWMIASNWSAGRTW